MRDWLDEFAGARFKVISGYDGIIKAANLALERGEVEAAMSSLPVLRAYWPQWLADKKIKIFFYQGMARSPDLPDVPASIELAKNRRRPRGHRFFRQKLFHLTGICRADPGVSPQVLGILREAFDATMKDDGFLGDCKCSNIEVNPKSGADLQKLVGEMVDITRCKRKSTAPCCPARRCRASASCAMCSPSVSSPARSCRITGFHPTTRAVGCIGYRLFDAALVGPETAMLWCANFHAGGMEWSAGTGWSMDSNAAAGLICGLE